MWALRKYYAGNGGCLPPNDPRIMSMTEEQMELELALIENEQKAIKKASGAKHYEDPDYEEEERKEEEIDSILSYEYDDPWDTPRESAPKTRAVEDWEDIETDDLDSDDWDE